MADAEAEEEPAGVLLGDLAVSRSGGLGGMRPDARDAGGDDGALRRLQEVTARSNSAVPLGNQMVPKPRSSSSAAASTASSRSPHS